MNLVAIHNTADILSDTPALVTVYNGSGKSLGKALAGLLGRALKRGHAVVVSLSRDYVETRAGRTSKGRVEVEVYEDGSGLEVAAFGYVLVLGAERKGKAMAEVSRPAASGAPC